MRGEATKVGVGLTVGEVGGGTLAVPLSDCVFDPETELERDLVIEGEEEGLPLPVGVFTFDKEKPLEVLTMGDCEEEAEGTSVVV